MIYTVTLNPSLDYIIQVNDFKENTINRVDKENIYIGGKGINVSTVLKENNIESTCLGFVGGFTGKHIEDGLKEIGIQTNFVRVDGNTRINVKMESDGETEINGSGPSISTEQLNEFMNIISSIAEGIVVVSGSVPKSLEKTIYRDIAKRLNRNVKLVVDAEGSLLLDTLLYHPFLIKPNDSELSSMLNTEINSFEEAILGAKQLQKQGARNVIVSLGGKGAVFVSEDGECYTCNAPKGNVKNTIGSGDSVIAGFLAYYSKHKELKDCFAYGVACGSASAFSERLCTKEEAIKLYENIEVETWKK